jgi:hypothetical protein
MMVSWCGIFSIPGIVLFIGIIASLLAGAKSLRPLLIGLLVLIGVGILFMYGSFVPVEHRPSWSRVSSPLPGVMEAEFEPDIYPSLLSAAKGLVKRASNHLDDGYRLGNLTFSANLSPSDEDQIRGLLQKAFPSRGAATQPAQGGDKVIDIHVGVKVEPDGKSYLETSFKEGEKNVTVGTWFAHKEWVDSFAQFMASHSDKNLIVAQSGQACTTEAEATQQAYQDAAKKLLPYVEGQFRRFRLYRDIREEELLPLILSHLQGIAGENLVRDQFVQSYHRPYGTIWSKTLLLDAQPSNILTLERACRKEYYRGLRSTGYVLLSGLVLMGMICLLYWLVNSYTKGYYTWPLRTVAVIVILGIVWMKLRGGF